MPWPGSFLEPTQTSQERTWELRGFPGSPLVNGLRFHCRGASSSPGQGTKPLQQQQKKNHLGVYNKASTEPILNIEGNRLVTA